MNSIRRHIYAKLLVSTKFAALAKTIITASRSIGEGAAMKFGTFPETKLLPPGREH